MGSERLRFPLAALVAVLATGCQEAGTTDDAAAPAEQYVVTRVNDGDTLTLAGAGKIRLLQVDAPELFTDCHGRRAHETLRELARVGTRVGLVADSSLDDRDRFGRPLRYVFAGGTNVNVELVRQGAASPYFFRSRRGRYADELLGAVEEARDARRGYWGACPRAELNTGLGSVTGPAD